MFLGNKIVQIFAEVGIPSIQTDTNGKVVVAGGYSVKV